MMLRHMMRPNTVFRVTRMILLCVVVAVVFFRTLARTLTNQNLINECRFKSSAVVNHTVRVI